MITIIFLVFIVLIVLSKFNYNYEQFYNQNYKKIKKNKKERKKNFKKHGVRETNEQREDRLEDEREMNERASNFDLTGYKETNKDKNNRLSDEDYYFQETIKKIIKKLRMNKQYVTKENINKLLDEELKEINLDNYDIILNEKNTDSLKSNSQLVSQEEDENINLDIEGEYEEKVYDEISGEVIPGIDLNKLYYEISYNNNNNNNELLNVNKILDKKYNQNVTGLDINNQYYELK